MFEKVRTWIRNFARRDILSDGFLFMLHISLITFLLVLLIAILNVASRAADDISMLRVFSSDEALAVEQVVSNLKKGNLDPDGFYNYGYLYNSLAYFTLRTSSAFGLNATTEQSIALCMRSLSVLFYLATIVFLYLTARHLRIERSFAAVFTFLFMSFKDFVYWAHHIHPDVLQTFWVVLSFYVTAKVRRYPLSVLLSSFLLGLAFGTKYSGLFAMAVPVTVVLQKTFSTARRKGTVSATKNALFLLFLLSLAFVVGWLIVNPYVPLHPIDFLKDFISEGRHVARGHGRMESSAGYLWWGVIAKETSQATLVFLVAALVTAVYQLSKRLLQQTSSWDLPEDVLDNELLFALTVYFLAGSLYLVFFVNMRVPRFFLHLWPALVLLSAWGCARAVDLVSGPRKQKMELIFAVLICALAIPVYLRNFRSIDAEIRKISNSPAIEVGRRLETMYPENTKILAGYYSYISSQRFKNAKVEFELDLKTIKKNNPDVIVMNRICPGRYVWKKPNTQLKDQKFVLGKYDKMKPHLKAMEYLLSRNSPYQIVLETDDFAVLEKSGNSN